MNTYIQDKLDAFRKFQEENGIFIKYLGEETQLKFTMYDDFLFQSLTDYHNHIVEKIQKEKLTDEQEAKFDDDPDNKLSIGYFIGYNQSIADILKLLQDTNPKE